MIGDKRCIGCNMPSSDGTLFLCEDGLTCGACLRQENRDLHQRDAMNSAIVRDFAAIEPLDVQYSGGGPEEVTCFYCDGPMVHEGESFKHADACPWRRAVEATKP